MQMSQAQKPVHTKTTIKILKCAEPFKMIVPQ